jgi:benzoate-CoA ligase
MYRTCCARARRLVSAKSGICPAGEKLPESLYDDWLELCGKPILDCVGASETVFLFLVNPPDGSRGGASGKRVPWAEVRLVDEDGRDITEPDTPGQIAIRTSCQFVGYWKQPELSARTLRDGWYYPGDMFRLMPKATGTTGEPTTC